MLQNYEYKGDYGGRAVHVAMRNGDLTIAVDGTASAHGSLQAGGIVWVGDFSAIPGWLATWLPNELMSAWRPMATREAAAEGERARVGGATYDDRDRLWKQEMRSSARAKWDATLRILPEADARSAWESGLKG